MLRGAGRRGHQRIYQKGLSVLALLVLLGGLSGCAASGPSHYVERHEIKSLSVVFLDEQSLQQRYAVLSGRPAVSISGSASSLSLNTVRGFYDFDTQTLYCTKMDFTVCGHELHHAVLGRFHAD